MFDGRCARNRGIPMSNKYDSEKTFLSLFKNGTNFGAYYKTDLEKIFLSNLFPENTKIEQRKIKDVELNSKILQVISNDKPDLLLVQNGNVIGIEHFMIDESLNTDRGSSFLKKYLKIDKNELTSVKKDFNEDSYSIIPMEIDLSTKNFYINMKENFNRHYEKIDSYDEKIKEEIPILKNKVQYFFFIECNNVFPFKISNVKNEMIYSYPHNNVSFLEYFVTKKKIKGLFFSYYTCQPNNRVDFVLLDENNISQYKELKKKGSVCFSEENATVTPLISRIYIKQ
jgi:hypothetical protein